MKLDIIVFSAVDIEDSVEALLDELPERPHCHRCYECDTIWEHCTPPKSATKEEFIKAHQCPKCGKEQRWKYDRLSDETIHFPWNGDQPCKP